MKRIVLIIAILLPAMVMHSSFTMDNPKKKHECSVKCIKVCTEVNNNHQNVLIGLQQRLQSRQRLGNASGKPCNHIKSEGLELLFAEPELCATQSPVASVQSSKSVSSLTEIIKPTQYDNNLESLLHELEKDLPPLPIKKITLIKLAQEFTTLMNRAGSQIKSLLKAESTETDLNNLDATCRELEVKNNMLPDIIRMASEAEKNNPEFLRLISLVSRANEAVIILANKEQLIDCVADFTHPFNSYKNEIQLLQRLLNQK